MITRRVLLRSAAAVVAAPALIRPSAAQILQFSGRAGGVPPPPGPGQLRCGQTFPDSSNTGVPAGTVLTPTGSITSSSNGQVIENLDVAGKISVTHSNVTVRNCRITSNDSLILECVNVTGTAVTVERCYIDCAGLTQTGILGTGTFQYNEIVHWDDGIHVTGDDCLMLGNYIHSAVSGPEAHFDGIEINGNVSRPIIRGNTILLDKDQTAAINLNDYFGTLFTPLVENNYFAGGAYAIYYTGSVTGGTVRNNVIGSGVWSYMNHAGGAPFTQSGNVDADTCNPITLS